MNQEKKWYQRIPHAYALLFFIIVFAWVLTFIVPAGEFERVEQDGRMVVVPGSFHYVEGETLGVLDLFMALPEGMTHAGNIIFLVFLAGGLFKILETSGAIENGIGVALQKFGGSDKARAGMMFVMTFIYGFLGAVVGFENLIPFVPIAILMAKGLGYDQLVGAGMAVGGITVGFAASPINPYTVGVSHAIAELPMFSGMGLRTVFIVGALALMAHHTLSYARRVEKDPSKSLVSDIEVTGMEMEKNIDEYQLTGRHKTVLAVFILMLAIIVFGITQYGWYLMEISALFIIAAIVIGIINRLSIDDFCNTFIKGMAGMTLGAIIVGVARGITWVLENGGINDTIIYNIAAPLEHLPTTVSALLMSLAHGVINFFIPSGSGQAMATMPIMIPTADIIGMTRQTAVLAFQIGDGIMNLIIPTLGGLLAMLAIANVPYERWVRFIWFLVVKFVLWGWILTLVAVATGYGPF